MEHLLNYYQDQAERSLSAMHRAMQRYEATQDSDWLMISFEWEANAYRYLELAEHILEFL